MDACGAVRAAGASCCLLLLVCLLPARSRAHLISVSFSTARTPAVERHCSGRSLMPTRLRAMGASGRQLPGAPSWGGMLLESTYVAYDASTCTTVCAQRRTSSSWILRPGPIPEGGLDFVDAYYVCAQRSVEARSALLCRVRARHR